MSMRGPKPWKKWSAEQHIDEAERLAETNPALAQIHTTLATTKMVQYQAKIRFTP